MATVRVGVVLDFWMISIHCSGNPERLSKVALDPRLGREILTDVSGFLEPPHVGCEKQDRKREVSVDNWAKCDCCIEVHKANENCNRSVHGEWRDAT